MTHTISNSFPAWDAATRQARVRPKAAGASTWTAPRLIDSPRSKDRSWTPPTRQYCKITAFHHSASSSSLFRILPPKSFDSHVSRLRSTSSSASENITIGDGKGLWDGSFRFLCAILFGASLAIIPAAVAATTLPKVELFEPMRYVGRWYEVASLKKGFAGEGQQDCHCTQGIYMPIKNEKDEIRLEVNTFCFHGSPNGRLSGIRGDVTCANPRDLYLLPEFETAFEREEKIREKCILRFPQIPFIPPEPYDVIRTDYENYAIVQGATDTSFVQIYSRIPRPGQQFIDRQKAFLKQFGYAVDEIVPTPQVAGDCEEVSTATLMSMMSNDKMMEAVLTNTAPETEIESAVRFEGPRNLQRSIRDFFEVFGKSG